MWIETCAKIYVQKVFVSFSRTDVIQISKNKFYLLDFVQETAKQWEQLESNNYDQMDEKVRSFYLKRVLLIVEHQKNVLH